MLPNVPSQQEIYRLISMTGIASFNMSKQKAGIPRKQKKERKGKEAK